MARTRFRDGASILATYTLDVMHDAEQENGQTRNISHTAPTSGIGFVRQQGEKQPTTFRFTGTILRQSQVDAMQDYYDACDNRTVFFTDIDGTEYEVLVTVFSSTRTRGHNARGGLPYYWKYRLEMEVIA